MCYQCKAEGSHSRWLLALASNLFVNSERFRNVITGCQWNPVSCCDHMVWKLLLLYRLISAALLAICLSDIIKASLQLQGSPRSCNAEMSESVTWGQMERCQVEAEWSRLEQEAGFLKVGHTSRSLQYHSISGTRYWLIGLMIAWILQIGLFFIYFIFINLVNVLYFVPTHLYY